MTESLLKGERVVVSQNANSCSAYNFNTTSYLDSKRSKISIAVGDQSMTEVIRVTSRTNNADADKRRSVFQLSSSSQIDLSDAVEVAFSVFIKFQPGLENQTFPWIIKEKLAVSRETTMLDLVLIFINICNSNHLKSKGLCFRFPLRTYEEEGYLVKPLKKSGKPDMDLPSFEKTSKVSELGASEFSLVYSPESIRELNEKPPQIQESIKIQSSMETEAPVVQKKSKGCCEGCCIIM